MTIQPTAPVNRASTAPVTLDLDGVPASARPAVRAEGPSKAHRVAVLGAPNLGLELEKPAAPASATDAIVSDPSLLRSPALLIDYQGWTRDFNEVNARGSATRAYRELALILYDNQIARPWGDQYFPEVQKRLAEFRRHFCAGEEPLACTVPTEVHDEAGLEALANALKDPRLLEQLRTRWGVHVHSAVFLNAPRSFDLLMSKREQQESETLSFWRMRPSEVQWTFATPVQTGVDAYLAGFNQREFAGQFALGEGGVLVDDVLLRDRSATFAHNWKHEIRVGRTHRRDNPVFDSTSVQYRRLFEEHRAEFDATYAQLLAKVQTSPDTAARFLRERQAGDYPEEVYQHVAYAHLRDLARMNSGYFALAKDQRGGASDGQVRLESLLTLQRYSPSWRFFLLDLTTQSEVMMASAAVLDQMVDPMLAATYAAEQLKAILGMDVYANADLYERMRYAVLADELFDPSYLQERRPELYRELLQADGTLKRVADLPKADQLRIMRSYLTNDNGATSLTGVLRMRAVLAARIREDDLRTLADVIHRAKMPD